MYVDVWSVVAKQERELSSIMKLCKLKLINPSPNVAFFVAYYRVSNAVLKVLLKAEVRLQALLMVVKGNEKIANSTRKANPSTHPSLPPRLTNVISTSNHFHSQIFLVFRAIFAKT